MIKKLLISTITASILSTQSVFASLNANIPVVNNAFNSVKLDGNSDDDVLIRIIKPNKLLSNVIQDESDLFVIDELCVDSDGYFIQNYELNDSDKQGKYYVYFNSDDETACKQFYFINKTTRDEWFDRIQEKTLPEEISDYLLLPIESLNDDSIKKTDVLSIDGSEIDIVSKFLYNSKKLYSNFTEMIDVINIAKITYKIENDEDIFDESEKFKVEIPMRDQKIKDIFQVYNDILSNSGKRLVITGLKSQKILSFSDFYEKFAELCCTYSINYAEPKGYGHLTDVINKTKKVVANMDIGNYSDNSNSNSQIDSALIRCNITDFDELCSKIKELSANNNVSIDDRSTTPNKVSTSSGGGFSGGGNSVNETLTPLTGKTQFEDLDECAWAKEPIENLFSKGIISGVSENRFEPNREAKREEFIKMLVVALGLQSGEASMDFRDVDENAWYYKYISIALKNGIVAGKDNGLFGINESILRQDCCTFIARALKLKNGSEELNFGDKHEISEYAIESVCAVKEKGIVSGDETGNFNPLKSCTRAEAAVIIYNMLNNIAN